ncbi:MAG: hypothetical protein R3D86_14170 [Emcibacteraceae bacterium]
MLKILKNFVKKLKENVGLATFLYTILAPIVSFLSAYFASTSPWLDKYGNIAWIAAALISALIITLIFLILVKIFELISKVQLNYAISIKSHKINPLEDQFSKKVIDLIDFESPGDLLYKGKHFKECQFRGPGYIFFGTGCNVQYNTFFATGDFIVIDEGTDIRPVIAFQDSSFYKCEFYRIGLMGPKQIKEKFLGQSEQKKPPEEVQTA